MPLNNPAMLRDLPGLLSNRRNSLRYDIRYVLKNLSWAVPFLRNALPTQVARTTKAELHVVKPEQSDKSALLRITAAFNASQACQARLRTILAQFHNSHNLHPAEPK